MACHFQTCGIILNPTALVGDQASRQFTTDAPLTIAHADPGESLQFVDRSDTISHSRTDLAERHLFAATDDRIIICESVELWTRGKELTKQASEALPRVSLGCNLAIRFLATSSVRCPRR